MIVAVGSLRKPKLEAVSAAFSRISSLFPENKGDLEILPFEVESGISSMPLSQPELLQGAKNRAQNVFAMVAHSDLQAEFCLGLEGGFFSQVIAEENHVFLQSWAYCLAGNKGYWGSSGAVPVPAEIADNVYKNGAELGLIIDRYGCENDIRSKGGAYDVFTRGMINRKQSFELAIIAALAPFFNPGLYRI